MSEEDGWAKESSKKLAVEDENIELFGEVSEKDWRSKTSKNNMEQISQFKKQSWSSLTQNVEYFDKFVKQPYNAKK